MKKMIAFLDVGLVGCDSVEPFLVSEKATQREIDDIVNEMAMEHAQSWEDGETEEEVEDFYQNVGGHAEEYNGEDHDGQRAGGGSFADDFEWMAKRGY